MEMRTKMTTMRMRMPKNMIVEESDGYAVLMDERYSEDNRAPTLEEDNLVVDKLQGTLKRAMSSGSGSPCFSHIIMS